jgi:hypothetical protein
MRNLIASIATLLVSVAISGCSSEALPAPIRGYSRTILAVPHLRQEPLLCVPTSTAMVLAFYGDPRPPRLLKTLASGQPYDPAVPFTDFSITHYSDIIGGIRQLGYDWTQRTFPNSDAGFRDGLALIEAELRKGHPVLVDATVPTGHTFVIRGFDTDKHQLFIVDPDQPDPGYDLMSFNQFASVWNETAYGNNFRAMILTRERSGESII